MVSLLEFFLLLLLKGRTRLSPGRSSLPPKVFTALKTLSSVGESSGCHFPRENVQCSPLPHPPNLLNLELLQNTSVAWRSLPRKRNVNDYCLLAKPVKKEIPVQYLQQGSLILFFLLHCHIEWLSVLPGFCGIVLTGLWGQSLSPAYKDLIVQIYLLHYISACSFWSVVFTLGGGEHLTLLASSVRYRTLILFRFPSTKLANWHVR